MVKNFRFVEPGAVALSGAPETPEAVDWLAEQGIRTVLSLHPVPPEVQKRMRDRGIEWRPILVTDFAAGAPPEFAATLGFAAGRAQQDPSVLIH